MAWPGCVARCLPARFELLGDETLVRIDGLVASCCEACLVSSFLKFACGRGSCSAALLLDPACRLFGSIESLGGECVEHLQRHGAVDADTANPDARPIRFGQGTRAADIAVGVTGSRSVEDPHHVPAPRAANHAGQQ